MLKLVKNKDGDKLTDTQKKTQSAFLSVCAITAQCHALLNTSFNPPPTKPAWFDDLNSKLNDAKDAAKEWIDIIAPDISSTIPDLIINYQSSFSSAVDNIKELYTQNPNAKGKDDPTVQQAAYILNLISSQVKQQEGKVRDMSQRLSNWGEKMQKAHDALKSGATNIQNAETDLQTDIDKMNTSIDTNQKLIDEMNKRIIYAALAIVGGIFLAIVGVAIAVASVGTAATIGAGIAVIGVGGIAGGAAVWGMAQHQIDEAYSAISDEQKQKNADQQQLIALQGIALASNAAISCIEVATSTLSTFEITWGLLDKELQDVIAKLDNGASMDQIIGQKFFSESAYNEWEKSVDLANTLAGAAADISSKKAVEYRELPMKAAA